MTQQEDLAEFLAIKNELVSLLEPLDEGRLNQVPFPGSWTAGQLGEHLLKSYRSIDLSKVEGAPCPRPSGEKSPIIDAVFSDYTKKYTPPDRVVPSTERISRAQLLDGLRQVADAIAAFARAHDLSFTGPEFGFIGFGDMTAQEWIHFLTAHSKRHVRQLKNILAHL